MEIIKKIISLDGGVSRVGNNNFGVLTASTFYFKIQLNQTIDDLGLFTDHEFIPINDLNLTLSNKQKNLRLSGAYVDDWFVNSGKISGYSESRLEGLKTYDNSNQYIINFDVEKKIYQNYKNNVINGVSRVLSIDNNEINYTYDANNDLNIGGESQNSGILFNDDLLLGESKIKFNSEGWNSTNSTLSAIIKENYLIGIINPPEIENLVFIDRGNTNVMESHLRMSEIESLDHLSRYGNGFFNIVKQ